MLTLITGVPGSGKTAHVVEMILEELKKERKIYVVGIPDLVAYHRVPDESMPDGYRYFACEKGGNPKTWQKGTWLKIDTYEPTGLGEDELTDDFDDEMASCWKPNGNNCEDKGALVIIDECQTYFRPRSSAAKVPDYVAAFEVHRHQGLDFWLITQKPNLLDANVRALVSRHIHIHTTGMGRKRLEWSEAQDPKSKSARLMANVTSYKPNPKVFELYKSATMHTELKVRRPNSFYYLIAAFFVFLSIIVFLFFQFKSRFDVSEEHVQALNGETSKSQLVDFNNPENYQLLSNHVIDSSSVDSSREVSEETHLFRVIGMMSLGDSCSVILRAYFEDEPYDFSLDHLKYSDSFDACYYQDRRLKMGRFFRLRFDDVLVRPSSSRAVRATRAGEASLDGLSS